MHILNISLLNLGLRVPRIKFRPGPIPIDKFEGMQVIIHVEKVNVHLQEILATVIAVNDKGTMANAPGVIPLERGKDWELVSEITKPVPTTNLEIVEFGDWLGNPTSDLTKEMVDDMIRQIIRMKKGL